MGVREHRVWTSDSCVKLKDNARAHSNQIPLSEAPLKGFLAALVMVLRLCSSYQGG